MFWAGTMSEAQEASLGARRRQSPDPSHEFNPLLRRIRRKNSTHLENLFRIALQSVTGIRGLSG